MADLISVEEGIDFFDISVIVPKMELSGEISIQSYTERVKAIYDRAHGSTMAIATSMILANTIAVNECVVKADSPPTQQLERALLSELVAPNIGDIDKAVGVGSQIILTTIGVEAARGTTKPTEMVGIAAVAQLGSSAGDALVERTAWLTHNERVQEDVGSSAIYVALITKYLFDRAKASENHSLSWHVGIGVFATAAAFGVPALEGSQGGKLDFISHTVGLAVGYLAHRLNERKKITRDLLQST